MIYIEFIERKTGKRQQFGRWLGTGDYKKGERSK
jgi:hypothetical protein